MRLVLGSYYLDVPGGAVTYFATVAEHLQRLGHDVCAYTRDPGTVAEGLSARGVAVVGPEALPDECDAVLVQDAPTSYELAERYPRAGQVFVSHGAEFDFELPPQVPGVVGAVVVLNDRVRRRVEASGLEVEVVRMRQPIDPNRFRSHKVAPERPEKAVLLGNYLLGRRRELLVRSLDDAGIAWEQLGRVATVAADPSLALAGADIVVGYGRSILEGMSAGCAAYVYEFAADGWVTADTYPALEADGFAGTAVDGPTDPTRLARDLLEWNPGMSVVNRELIGRHHNVFDHVNQLAELLGRLAERRTPPEPRTELSRMVRLQWEAHLRATHFERELAASQARAFEAEKRALEAEGRLEEVRRSLRYRMAQALAAPFERLRSRRR